LRRTRAKGALIAAVTLALVALGFVLGRTMLQRREVARGSSYNLPANVSQRIRDFRRVKVDDGRTVWELNAREAEYFEDQGKVLVSRPQVSFFGADGQSVEVKGRQGRVYLEGSGLSKIELDGGIEVRVGGYVLHTEQAVWVQAQDVILSPGHVEVKGSEIAIEGNGMLVDLGRQRLELHHGVRTTLRGKAEGGAPGDGTNAAGALSSLASPARAPVEDATGPHATAN